VWVGLGSPKQDEWLATFRPLLHAPVLLAVGAAFDFHAGRRRRAPRWAQRAGLEWVFRLASEPRRMASRYSTAGVGFARLLAADALRRNEVTA
jgi:N-acetylglucosaminyldiphosphoundecaprenol N-acetyl-beta-D-mannosaminyltransferase